MTKKLMKTTVIFTIMAFIAKFIGLFRDMLITSAYGATEVSDAFNVAITVPNILYVVCAAAIMVTFLPNFLEVEKDEGTESAYKFANKFMTILLIISFIFYIVGVINTDIIVNALVPNLSNDALELTIKLTRITLINLIFSVISSVYSAILRSKDKFLITSIMPIIANIPVILYLVINLYNNNIVWLTIITSVGLALQFIIFIPSLRKMNYRYKPNFTGYNDKIKDIFKKVLPIMFGLAVSQLSIIIDKNIASGLDVGSITSLELSNKLVGVIYGVLSSTVVTIFSPILARQFLNKDKTEWLNTINSTIAYMLLLTIPISFGIFILNINVIELLYGRGAFTSEAVNLLSLGLIGYLLQLPFMAIRDLLGQGFYSTKNTIIPSINGLVAVGLNIVLTILFSKIWGLFGITFATSISMILSALLLIISFKRIYSGFQVKKLLIKFIKITFSAIVMCVIIYAIKGLLWNNNIFIIVVCGLLGVVIQAILNKAFKIEEFEELYNVIISKIKKKKSEGNESIG